VATLRQYDAIGLINVAASQLGSDALTALQAYVHDFGGGLVVIGGDNSYGVGGYRGTPLEEALPLSMDVRGLTNHPGVAVALIVEDLESSDSDDIAKLAADKVVQQLTPQDEVAVSDASTGFPVPLRPVTDPNALQQAINTMQTGDPQSYAPYLLSAAQQLASSKAQIKHIILVGDGDAEDNYQPVIQQIVSQGITVSTIGTVADPSNDQSTMQNIANWGHGRYYVASNLDVPQVVLKETTIVNRAAVTEETFTPVRSDQTPVLGGIGALPALHGYIATTPKPAAVVGLVSPEQDPILAQWQYGLGRAVAFTSDVTAGWSAEWVRWQGFSPFWAQVFSWVVPAPQSQNLQTAVTVGSDGQATLQVDALTSQGEYVNGATTTATIVGPSGARQQVVLAQSAPGRYQGTVVADQPGSYLVAVSQSVPGQGGVVQQVAGFSVPYAPEFAGLPPNLGLLRQLAERTGGQILSAPAASFRHDLRPAEAAVPIWPVLSGALVPLFLLDVAVRRLRFSPADLGPVFAGLRVRWQGPTGRAAVLAGRLVAARQVARNTPKPAPRPATLGRPRATSAPVHPAPLPHPPTPPRPAPARVPVVTSGPTSNRLLAAKRRASSRT